jgi:hypothetical protein
MVIPMFEETHPNCDLLFAFDNSQNHHARSPDALYSYNLNLSDGGKNIKKMRDTTFIDRNGIQQTQLMQTGAGVQKGIKTILIERGLWPTDQQLKLECS